MIIKLLGTWKNVKKMRRIILLTQAVLCTVNLFSQNVVTGRLKETSGEAVAYANAVILNVPDSAFISGCTSDDSGIFTFAHIPAGHFILKLSYLGYNDHIQNVTVEKGKTNVGTILLQEATEALDEVTVIANRLRVYNKGGNLVTDIANSTLRNIGSAKEVMKHIPGVITTKDKYEVFGKGSPVIYINNKKVRDNNELQMLKSTDILNVEVITNPGAGYDADTRAVVKITTNKKRSNGLMAQVDAEAAQSNHFSHNESASISYQLNKLNVFGSYRFDHIKEDIKYDVTQTSHEKKLTYNEISSSKYTDKSNEHSYSAGMNYDFDERNSIGIQYAGYDSHLKTVSRPEEDWIKMYEDNTLFADNNNALSGKDNSQFHNVSMYYQTQATDKLSIQIDADYAYNKVKSHELVKEAFNLTDAMEETNTYSHNSSKMYAAKGVFHYTFNNNHSLEWGVDYSNVGIAGESQNPEGKITSDEYDNREDKYAVFALYRTQYKKLQGEMGGRYEYVQSQTTDFGEIVGKKNYSDFLPSLSLSLPISKVGLSLNFTNRIQRPSFDQLNNKVKYNNQFHQEKGNPNLTPQKIYDVDFSVKYSALHFRLNYQYIKNFIYTTAEQSDETGGSSIWYTTNAPRYELLGAVLVASPTFGCWRPTLTAGIYKPFLTLDYLGSPLDYNKPYGLFSLQNEFTLPKDFVLRADLQWNTKGNRGIYYMKSFGYSEISVQKSFLSDCLHLTLRGEDLFNWSKTKDTKYLNYLVSNRATNPYGRRVVFSISWNFNNFKTKFKGIGAGEDEKNRL